MSYALACNAAGKYLEDFRGSPIADGCTGRVPLKSIYMNLAARLWELHVAMSLAGRSIILQPVASAYMRNSVHLMHFIL